MNRAVLMSIQPQHACNILNEKKTIEIRKIFPKDFRGWVYMYVTKGELLQAHWGICNNGKDVHILYGRKCKERDLESPHTENGKVVARFYVDNVEEIIFNGFFAPQDNEYTTKTMNGKELMKTSCLDLNTLVYYLENRSVGKIGKQVACAIHISELEIFEKPKELNEFGITRSPQSWMYIEMGE